MESRFEIAQPGRVLKTDRRRNWAIRPALSFVILIQVLGCNSDRADSTPTRFVPDSFVVPASFQHAEFELRPIRQSDAERDHAAVMSSATNLRIQFDSDWPSDEFTIEENRQQLAIHEQQFDNRSAFVYTVISLDGARVLGCVYITPDELMAQDAVVKYWVRSDLLDSGLPQSLATALRDWLKNEWPFHAVKFAGPGDSK